MALAVQYVVGELTCATHGRGGAEQEYVGVAIGSRKDMRKCSACFQVDGTIIIMTVRLDMAPRSSCQQDLASGPGCGQVMLSGLGMQASLILFSRDSGLPVPRPPINAGSNQKLIEDQGSRARSAD